MSLNDLANKVADRLQGQCVLSLEDVCEQEGIDDTQDLRLAIDQLVFLCEECNWWCEISEMEDDWVCDDCCDGSDEEE